VTPTEIDDAKHVYHIYGVHVCDRDELLRSLQAGGVGCAIHYPVPIHRQRAYESMGHKKGDFPLSEKSADRELSLPMFAEMTDEQIHFVAETLADLIDRREVKVHCA
jgi:dTDP-4-amino-4,6-dideoxygalactose transaminase